MMHRLLAIIMAMAATDASAQVAAIERHRSVQTATQHVRDEDAATLADQIMLAEIPAPGEGERRRAEAFRDKLRGYGLDARIDAAGNVVSRRRGVGKGPLLMLSAHLDSVFPADADVAVTKRDGRYYGRGIADDARGLAAVLAVARALQAAKIRTVGDILFVGTVGEEGLGNLRGAKAALADHPDTAAFITVEPRLDEGAGLGVGATGSRRWTITFKGPGGHSFSDFGRASAIHAAGRAIAEIDGLTVPEEPRTTYNVGLVSGGTSVNTIALDATIQIDIRSNSADTLAATERAIMGAIERGVAAANARAQGAPVTFERKLIGDRPAGGTDPDSPLVQAAVAASRAVRGAPPALTTNSTDAGAAVALGIPAIMMEGGGEAANLHSADEWFDPTDGWQGPQIVLLTAVALVGIEGVADPTLAPR